MHGANARGGRKVTSDAALQHVAATFELTFADFTR